MPSLDMQSPAQCWTACTSPHTRPHAVIRVRSAYHSEERKVQALYTLVVGINPPKPPSVVPPYGMPIVATTQKQNQKNINKSQ